MGECAREQRSGCGQGAGESSCSAAGWGCLRRNGGASVFNFWVWPASPLLGIWRQAGWDVCTCLQEAAADLGRDRAASATAVHQVGRTEWTDSGDVAGGVGVESPWRCWLLPTLGISMGGSEKGQKFPKTEPPSGPCPCPRVWDGPLCTELSTGQSGANG